MLNALGRQADMSYRLAFLNAETQILQKSLHQCQGWGAGAHPLVRHSINLSNLYQGQS